MTELSPLSEIKITADLSRPVMNVSWQDLASILGWKPAAMEPIRAKLEAGDPYNFQGIIMEATGKTLPAHTIRGVE